LCLERWGEVPRQEFLDAADGMVRDLGQHGAEIEFRIEAIQFCRSDEAVNGGVMFAATTSVIAKFVTSAPRL
jgi:hypothetical protein